ncbi:hypothetical protein VFPBJ_04245 [Purpureocillium lilacinum]|uniref:Uncharacterized protein n=1 Tax=Purpureocillium lilacinum TaxID=33203 RepID=A0A179GWQ0_PURLI|nr:hypothetical protein VFPBJ_04245 [Purpureocillium lilacinum]
MDGTLSNWSEDGTGLGSLVKGAKRTVISKHHEVDVEALAVVADGLQGVLLRPAEAAQPAEAREVEAQGAARVGLEGAVEDAAHEAQLEHLVLGLPGEALEQDGVYQLAREPVHGDGGGGGVCAWQRTRWSSSLSEAVIDGTDACLCRDPLTMTTPRGGGGAGAWRKRRSAGI